MNVVWNYGKHALECNLNERCKLSLLQLNVACINGFVVGILN